MRRLFHERTTQKLSVQALETLAVIAYKQPITAAEINEIRGVNTSGVLKTLLERHLVKIVGRKQVVGRPFLYATTKEFLIRFGLNDLTDLPKVEDMAEALGFECRCWWNSRWSTRCCRWSSRNDVAAERRPGIRAGRIGPRTAEDAVGTRPRALSPAPPFGDPLQSIRVRLRPLDSSQYASAGGARLPWGQFPPPPGFSLGSEWADRDPLEVRTGWPIASHIFRTCRLRPSGP